MTRFEVRGVAAIPPTNTSALTFTASRKCRDAGACGHQRGRVGRPKWISGEAAAQMCASWPLASNSLPRPHFEAAPTIAGPDDYEDFDDSEDCPNCGGEGIVYNCFEEFACIDPEGGCDLCARRCDWCRQ